MTLPLSIVVLARDEAKNLARCLPPLAFAGEVVVVDDRSVDGTSEVARANGARVVSHEMHSFADQRNWAMESAGLKYPWVLHLDADEVVTPELVCELEGRLAGAAGDLAGFHLARKVMMGEKWLRFSATYPVYVPRLVHRDRVRYAPCGHGECVSRADGRFEYLKEPFLHYNFSKGWSDWVDRHNRYSTREAERILQELPHLDLSGCLSLDPVRRRTALRGLSYRLPARSALRFLYVYVFRGGFLDGRAGWTYATLQAMYETMITLKVESGKRKAESRNSNSEI